MIVNGNLKVFLGRRSLTGYFRLEHLGKRNVRADSGPIAMDRRRDAPKQGGHEMRFGSFRVRLGAAMRCRGQYRRAGTSCLTGIWRTGLEFIVKIAIDGI
jgi:hypothetical protein